MTGKGKKRVFGLAVVAAMTLSLWGSAHAGAQLEELVWNKGEQVNFSDGNLMVRTGDGGVEIKDKNSVVKKRFPKGVRIVKDPQGRVFVILKEFQAGTFSGISKITVRDWNSPTAPIQPGSIKMTTPPLKPGNWNSPTAPGR